MLQAVTPLNYTPQHERFIEEAKKGRFINPVFYYAENYVPTDNDELVKALQDSQMKESPRDAFVTGLVIQELERINMIAQVQHSISVGDDEATNLLLLDYYGGPTSSELIDLAYDIAKGGTVKNERLEGTQVVLTADQAKTFEAKKLDAQKIAAIFQDTLHNYGLKSWSAIVDNSYSAVTVNAANSSIHIPTNRECSQLKTIELIAHEIECHARHNSNCAWLLTNFFNVPTGVAKILVSKKDSTATEGFAKMSDAIIDKKCRTKIPGTPKPWYILAALLAADGISFAEVAEYLYEAGQDIESAWKYTYRVFRGCTDVAHNIHKYARLADRCYLEGYVYAITASENNSATFDYAKFNENELTEIEKIIGTPLSNICPAYPYLGIAEQMVDKITATS